MISAMYIRLVSIALLLQSCSPTTMYVRAAPQLKSDNNAVDTIAIISDALVAIDDKEDFFSVNASSLIDSLTLSGIKEVLTSKGYYVTTTKSFMMGSFMDTTTSVPVKAFNSGTITKSPPPYIFANDSNRESLKVIEKIIRKSYLSSTTFKYNPIDLLDKKIITKSDLDLLKRSTNSNYALIALQQMLLVDDNISGLMLTGAILVGSPIIVYKKNVFYTYIFLLDVTSGSIVWSNFSNLNALRMLPIRDFAFKYEKPVSSIVNMDSLSEKNLKNWRRVLRSIPDRNKQKTFFSKKNSLHYPYLDNQFRSRTPDYIDISNKTLKRRIDSLVSTLSLLDTVPQWHGKDTSCSLDDLKRSINTIKSTLFECNKHFRYACNNRLKYTFKVKGTMNVSFLITEKGYVRNIKINESTFNDPVIEYVFRDILSRTNFGTTNTKVGVTNFTHDITINVKPDQLPNIHITLPVL